MPNEAEVTSLFSQCLHSSQQNIIKTPFGHMPDDRTEQGDFIVVDGIAERYYFDRSKVEQYREKILSFLQELPEEFFPPEYALYDGASILFFNEDRHGRAWTTLVNSYKLLALGMAIGCAVFTYQRHSWNMLPGGHPFIKVTIPS